MKYPAIDVRQGGTDLMLAIVDDFSPTAIEERADSSRIFFSTISHRDLASNALAAAGYSVEAREVDDEDWARRSQAGLRPITVGQVTVLSNPQSPIPNPGRITIVINPSMGFGTGHHATTRLCLEALQAISLAGAVVVDVGTGSGILAIAAARLGAARVVGIDNDAAAIQSANENLSQNPDARNVEFLVGDLRENGLPMADVVTANLTGGLLVGASTELLACLKPGGTLILSGIPADERDEVRRAFGIAGPHKARSTPSISPDPIGSGLCTRGEDLGRTLPDAYVGRTLSGPPEYVVGRTLPDACVGRTLSGPPEIFWEQQTDEWLGMAVRRV